MPGTILVRDAVWRISTLMNDVAPQFVRWSEREIINCVGDAELAIHKFLPAATARIVAIKLKPGTLQSIETILAADCLINGVVASANVLGTQVLDVLCNMGADGLTPGGAIRLVMDGREVLDTISPNWHSSVGTSVQLYVFDPRTPRNFLVKPGVHPTTPVWIRGSITSQPARIPNTGTPEAPLYLYDGSNATLLSVNDEHIDDVVNYTCARLFMKNAQAGNNNQAAMFTNAFTGSLNAKVTALTGNNPNLQRLPFAPEPIGAAK